MFFGSKTNFLLKHDLKFDFKMFDEFDFAFRTFFVSHLRSLRGSGVEDRSINTSVRECSIIQMVSIAI